MEETERMRLYDLRQIHESAQFDRSGRYRDRKDTVPGFCRCQKMTDRTNATDPRAQACHLSKWSPFAKAFKAAKLRDVKSRISHLVAVVQKYSDLSVPFDPRDWVDNDA